MNTNSITKFFTLVSFFVVSVLMMATTASAAENKEQCESRLKKAGSPACIQKYSDDPTKQSSCISMINTSECDGLDSKEDSTANDSDCEDAYKDYKEGLDETQSACESISGKSSSRSRDSKAVCSEKIKKCEKLARENASYAQNQQGDNQYTQTYDILRDVISGEDPNILGGGSSDSCMIDLDSKEAQDAEKDFRDRRKELEKEKKDIEDQAIKDKEDNDKEITRIQKEIQELGRDNKELLAKKDAEMSEQLNQNQKDMVDAAKRIRDLTNQMTKENDAVRQKTFSFNEALQDLSKSKVDIKCKELFNQAKECMIKSAKNSFKSAEEAAACKGFPTLRSKGPKATAELKAQLQSVNDACYEQASKVKRQEQFKQQEEIKKSTDKINELQAQLRDESQRQQIQSERSQTIQQEAQRAKDEAAANLAEQQATLQNEMAQASQKYQAQIQTSNQRLQKLQQDLANLELEEKTGKRSKTSYASKAIRKTNAALNEVVSQCKCKSGSDLVKAKAGDEAESGASEKGKRVCAAVKRNLPSGTDESSGRKKGKSSSVF